MKPDKSGRIKITAVNVGASQGILNPKLVKEIADLTPAFFEALNNVYDGNGRKRKKTK